MRFHFIKKIAILVVSAITLSFLSLTNLKAQDEGYLQQIAFNTNGILQRVNNLPGILEALGQFIISWMTPDNSDATAQLQGNFATIGSLIVQNSAANNSGLQLQLMADLFSPPPPEAKLTPANLAAPPDNPNSILKTLPNVNDLTYLSFLGQPPAPKAKDVAKAPYNYLSNASGITLFHVMPGLNWQGPIADQVKYTNYYNTLMAVESFNAYVLSQYYAEGQNASAFTTAQNALITQASSSSWIAEITTQELGKVIRQILLFQSQTYVLLSQLIQTQKQLVAAQVMSNSLIIANNQAIESTLVSRAQGVKPQP